MPLDPQQTTQQISDSIGAMLLLNSSCQALIQAEISPSSSPWYPILNQELGQAENLVVGWRQNGYRYFQTEILQQIDACAQRFLAAQPHIDGLFASLEQQFDPSITAQIATQLDDLNAPVNGMMSSLQGYIAKLSAFKQQMNVPYQQMNQSVAQIQAEAADIQQEINSINTQIALLQQQVQTDRDAIAKAEAQRTSGIIETIFGVLLAPVTGGLSLILAGIGVGSIAEAQEQINSLESTISQYQTSITSDQQHLSSDQQQIATLNGLTMSVSMILNDMNMISSALDALEVTWDVLLGELTNAANDVRLAETTDQAIVAQVWFDAACVAWQQIDQFVQSMQAQNAPVPHVVMVG